MNTQKKYNVIGIMSGTSMDGVDCSYIKTDGKNFVSIIIESSYKYSKNYKNKLKKIIKLFNENKLLRKKQYSKVFDDNISNKFIQIIKKFIKEHKINKSLIDYIGLSGQTVLHDPINYKTIQLGNCKKIQENLKIKIVGNFRENDISNGGQGAPIGAFYHKYILTNFVSSAAIINLGGIANICCYNNKELIAFDLGPANAIIDDLMFYFYNKNYDEDGNKAFKGNVNKKLIKKFKSDIFFNKNYPKSLDREYFKSYYNQLKKINKLDAICTASIMTLEGIKLGIKLINKKIKTIILTGGGRKNLFLVNNLKKQFKRNKINIIMIDSLNFNGDLLEAQAFAYLAIRCVKKLPLSLPTTTGVKKPTLGGIIYE